MQRIAYSTQRGIVYLPAVKTSRAPLPPGMAMPGVEPAINAVDLIKPLLQQILRGALTAVAVIAHHHHRRVKVVITHKRAQRIVGQMKRARRMAHRIALRIADIHQHCLLLMQLLVRFFNIDTFKLFHGSLLFLVMTGDGRPNFTL